MPVSLATALLPVESESKVERCADAVAFAYPAPPGVGGLGAHAAQVLDCFAGAIPRLETFGPGAPENDPVNTHRHHAVPATVPSWQRRYTWLRYATGAFQLKVDRRVGEWLATELRNQSFSHAYLFTQIALESLEYARQVGASTVLDSPTGHIRHFRDALCRESARWTGWRYLGHPSAAMVDRVEEEYRAADAIRVSSTWSRQTLIDGGVPADKILVAPQTVNIRRFVPPRSARVASGPLRVAFVGSFSLGKGFQYLLDAVRRLGPSRVSVRMVGATGDPWSRHLFARLSAGLDISHAPGDPVAAYQWAELFVLPTIHDGFGLVVAEAMACGLPIVTTDCCGAGEWIQPGESGWVVRAGDSDALTEAIEDALARRHELRDRGHLARLSAERLVAAEHQLRDRVLNLWQQTT